MSIKAPITIASKLQSLSWTIFVKKVAKSSIQIINLPQVFLFKQLAPGVKFLIHEQSGILFVRKERHFSGRTPAALFVATKTSWVFMMLPLRWNGSWDGLRMTVFFGTKNDLIYCSKKNCCAIRWTTKMSRWFWWCPFWKCTGTYGFLTFKCSFCLFFNFEKPGGWMIELNESQHLR